MPPFANAGLSLDKTLQGSITPNPFVCFNDGFAFLPSCRFPPKPLLPDTGTISGLNFPPAIAAAA
jgi:hypothetical protein